MTIILMIAAIPVAIILTYVGFCIGLLIGEYTRGSEN